MIAEQLILKVQLNGRIKETSHYHLSTSIRNNVPAYSKKKNISIHQPEFKVSRHDAYQCITFDTDTLRFFVSEAGKPTGIAPSNWKRLNQIERLRVNLQITADALAGFSGATFTYELIGEA